MKSLAHSLATFVVASVVVLRPEAPARAEGPICGSHLSRQELVACAIARSPAVRAELAGKAASEARETASSPWLPANPTVAFSIAQRNGANVSDTNWYVTLAQELELAGQRGARLDAARAQVEAQTSRVVLARRDAATHAWMTLFESVAAREALALSGRIEGVLARVERVSKAMADRGVLSGLEAAAAGAAYKESVALRLESQRRLGAAAATLAVLVGRPPGETVDVESDLEPLPLARDLARRAAIRLEERPELRALDAEAKAYAAQADALKRSRVPNVTLSAYAQNDGFSERVLGAGLSVPIPLPEPLGRFNNGQVAEARALAERTRADREGVRRALERDAAIAVRTYEIRLAQRDALSEDDAREAEALLERIGAEVEGGRLPIRDVLVVQQTLLSLLRNRVELRFQAALASVEVLRALGAPLEEGVQ